MSPDPADDLLDMLHVAHQRVADAIDTRSRIAADLLDAGFTSRRLAEVVGVTHQTVRNWAEAWR